MKKALLATLGFCLFFGLQITLQKKFLTSSVNPLHLNFLTYTVSFLILLIYFLIFKQKKTSLKKSFKSIIPIILAVVFWIAADLSSIYGLKVSSSINYSLLSRLTAMITYTLAVIFFGESLVKNKVIAILVAFIGSVLVVFNLNSKILINYGDFLFVGFALFNSISGLLRQKIRKNLDVIELTLIMFGLASFILGILILLVAPIRNINYFSFILVNAVLGLSGFTLVNMAIMEGGATFFSIVSSLLPISTAVFSFFILSKLPTINQLIGGLIIIGGIILFSKKK